MRIVIQTGRGFQGGGKIELSRKRGCIRLSACLFILLPVISRVVPRLAKINLPPPDGNRYRSALYNLTVY